MKASFIDRQMNMKTGMKFLAAGAVVAACISSCGLFQGGEVRFREYESHVEESPAAGGQNKVTIDIVLSVPEKGTCRQAIDAITGDIIREALGEDYAGMDVQEAIDGFTADIVGNYNETAVEFAEEFNKEGDEWSGTFEWTYDIKGRKEGEYRNWISYTVDTYSYLGGAHGGSVCSGLNFDRKSGKLLSEDDIFVYGYEETLNNALRSHLKSSLEEDRYGMLFDTDITPNGNFVLSSYGITYIYGQYEIGPYTAGIIKVSVPWDEIQSILR